jgi:hypothetical protein
MILSLLLAVVPLASSDPGVCAACCAAAAVPSACAEPLLVFAEGARRSPDGAGYLVAGAWRLGCGTGAVFDPSVTLRVDHLPLDGEVLQPALRSAQVECFAQACRVPAGLCLSPGDVEGRWTVTSCADGLPPSVTELRAPPTSALLDPVVVLLDGAPVVAERAGASAAPMRLPAAPVAPEAPVAAAPPPPPPAPSAPPPPPAPVAPVADVGESPSAQEAAAAALAEAFPADPPEVCAVVAVEVRDAARRRVEQGDEQRIRKELAGAVVQYRAAVTRDPCNGYAWLGLGEVAGAAMRPDLAIRALQNATRLLPRHYGALALLGRNYELIGQSVLAAEAYRSALVLSPSHPEAREGLRRVEPR